eukprot:14632428-Heterocapsa_arctica.AAC.1
MSTVASLQRRAGFARLPISLTTRSPIGLPPSSSIVSGMSSMNPHGHGLMKTGKSPMASGVMKPEA